MRRIEVLVDGVEFTFRTNDSGVCLFVGDSENRQISHECGFHKLNRIKRAIKDYFVYRGVVSRLKFSPSNDFEK